MSLASSLSSVSETALGYKGVTEKEGRIRNTGSIHSDHWYGNAADLAKKSAIGVYPIGGWWKENPSHARYNQRVRYCLVVSIRAANGEVDIYTPVHTAIGLAIAATTEI